MENSKKRNVFILGYCGNLAGEFPRWVSKFANENLKFHFVSHTKCDIANFRKLLDTLDDCEIKSGDIIVNCTGFTDVAACESNSEIAYKVNAEGVKNIASICQLFSLGLIHISTDYIYSGEMLSENGYSHVKDLIFEKPLNVYGSSKLEGEKNIERVMSCFNPNYLILRTSGLFGEKRTSFPHKILDNLKLRYDEKIQLPLYEDQYMSFTSCATLCQQIIKFLNIYDENENWEKIVEHYGNIINCVNVPEDFHNVSPYGFAKLMFTYLECPSLILKCIPTKFPKDGICPDKVCRPKNSMLFEDIANESYYIMPSFEKALKLFCLEQYDDLNISHELKFYIANEYFNRV